MVAATAGLVYCMNYIDHNFDWLEEKLEALEGKYVLFDFPGQVELYTHESSVYNILQKLQKLNYKVVRRSQRCDATVTLPISRRSIASLSCVSGSSRSCTWWTRTTAPTAPSSSRSCS